MDLQDGRVGMSILRGRKRAQLGVKGVASLAVGNPIATEARVEQNRLLENRATTLQAFVDAYQQCKIRANGPDMKKYRQAYAEREDALIEANRALSELEQHIRRFGVLINYDANAAPSRKLRR